MNIVFLCTAVGVRLDDLRRDAVKNTLDTLIVVQKPGFLQLFKRTLLFTLFQSVRQLGVFFL